MKKRPAKALEVAVSATSQETTPSFSPDQILEAFLLSKRVLVVPLSTEGDRNLFELGRPLGFNLLMTFDGMQYRYFGNFTALRPEAVIWRLRTLETIFSERFSSLPQRIKLGLAQINAQTAEALQMFLSQLQIWLLVSSNDDRTAVTDALAQKPASLPVQVFSLADIAAALLNMG